jgi:hypothetical protein
MRYRISKSRYVSGPPLRGRWIPVLSLLFAARIPSFILCLLFCPSSRILLYSSRSHWTHWAERRNWI